MIRYSAAQSRDGDIAAFDQALQQFYVNNPGELPLVQDLLDASAPRPDSGFTINSTCAFDSGNPPANL